MTSSWLTCTLHGSQVIALIPDISEITNGVAFALQDNVSLAIAVSSGGEERHSGLGQDLKASVKGV